MIYNQWPVVSGQGPVLVSWFLTIAFCFPIRTLRPLTADHWPLTTDHWLGQRPEGHILQCAIGHYQQPLPAQQAHNRREQHIAHTSGCLVHNLTICSLCYARATRILWRFVALVGKGERFVELSSKFLYLAPFGKLVAIDRGWSDCPEKASLFAE